MKYLFVELIVVTFIITLLLSCVNCQWGFNTLGFGTLGATTTPFIGAGIWGATTTTTPFLGTAGLGAWGATTSPFFFGANAAGLGANTWGTPFLLGANTAGLASFGALGATSTAAGLNAGLGWGGFGIGGF
ncbi:hypothetical protein ABK040_014624 [Willaertia magna]